MSEILAIREHDGLILANNFIESVILGKKLPPHELVLIGGALQGSVDKTVAVHSLIISDLLWLHKIGRNRMSGCKRF